VVVGIARLTLYLAGSQSLKDKRMVLRRVRDRVQNKFNVAFAEVEANEAWQRAVIGVTTVGNGERFVGQALDEVIRFIQGEAEVTRTEREVVTYSQPLAHDDLGFKYE